MKQRKFPFVPKSNKSLEVGDFWDIPLENSKFACGRVLAKLASEVKGRGTNSVFLGGLLDWCSYELPNENNIGGAKVLQSGASTVKMIQLCDGKILGNRPLERDNIECGYAIEYPDNATAHVYHGLTPIRKATKKEMESLPMLSWYGLKAMQHHANHYFKQKA